MVVFLFCWSNFLVLSMDIHSFDDQFIISCIFHEINFIHSCYLIYHQTMKLAPCFPWFCDIINFFYRLAELGQHVGVRILDLVFFKEKNLKRETKVVNMLNFIKGNLWKTLFSKEADMLEQDNEDDRTCILWLL